ncbi:WD domain, G-beta repeat protein [Dictyocaulus viviparus]|uniref:WD domain, G-beta repeat protein n=1 Tax=Dictyocaulus viviparus TaxID=29172 RepID=A0A0D8XTZ3_DICVI|nr:WD domain, G-beta repeat protein [Dictyocaulus viviparus]
MLRMFSVSALSAVTIGDVPLEHKVYKLFYDDQLMSFQRGVIFSPCGQLIIAPCANLEAGTRGNGALYAEIFWHDRKAMLSVDSHPVTENGAYRIVASGVQKEVRIWRFEYEQSAKISSKYQLAVTFLANLAGHNVAINQVKSSQNPELNLLASGDSDGRIAIWQLCNTPISSPPIDDLPPNKENWIRIRVLNHDNEVANLAWSPDGKLLASASSNESLLIHDISNGKRCVTVRNLRHFPSGVAWDPKGKHIVTMSTDRKMDLIGAARGRRLRMFSVSALSAVTIGDVPLQHKVYKLFHDDQLMSFQRGVVFSPCG